MVHGTAIERQVTAHVIPQFELLGAASRTSFEDDSVAFFAGKGHAQFEQLDDNFLELVEECLVVLSIALSMLFEFLIFDKNHIGGKHHKGFGFNILVLFGTIPLY